VWCPDNDSVTHKYLAEMRRLACDETPFLLVVQLRATNVAWWPDDGNDILLVNQCCICRLGESVGEGLECNFSATSAENIGISRKMSQDLKKIQKHSFFSIF
jgi:hypothetical protein